MYRWMRSFGSTPSRDEDGKRERAALCAPALVRLFPSDRKGKDDVPSVFTSASVGRDSLARRDSTSMKSAKEELERVSSDEKEEADDIFFNVLLCMSKLRLRAKMDVPEPLPKFSLSLPFFFLAQFFFVFYDG